jgi:hypothetical protein
VGGEEFRGVLSQLCVNGASEVELCAVQSFAPLGPAPSVPRKRNGTKQKMVICVRARL